MSSDRALTINHISAIVDTYGAAAHPLPALIEMRRNLAVYLYRLSSHVKSVYGSKATTYVLRKYAIAREMVVAMETDRKAGGKPRPISQIETQTEALDMILQARKTEAEADSEWEQVRAVLDMGKQILSAMSQEISDLKTEKQNPSYSEPRA